MRPRRVYQFQLTSGNRELDNRGIQLGRHRRAAYIFPELLADFDAAAVIWEEFKGRHAETFAHDMADPLVCMNRGGFLIAAGNGYCEVYGTQG